MMMMMMTTVIVIVAAAETCLHWEVHSRQHNTNKSTKQKQHAGQLINVLFTQHTLRYVTFVYLCYRKYVSRLSVCRP